MGRQHGDDWRRPASLFTHNNIPSIPHQGLLHQHLTESGYRDEIAPTNAQNQDKTTNTFTRFPFPLSKPEPVEAICYGMAWMHSLSWWGQPSRSHLGHSFMFFLEVITSLQHSPEEVAKPRPPEQWAPPSAWVLVLLLFSRVVWGNESRWFPLVDISDPGVQRQGPVPMFIASEKTGACNDLQWMNEPLPWNPHSSCPGLPT